MSLLVRGFVLCLLGLLALLSGGQPKTAQAPLMTRWAKEVSPRKVHADYPRPQLARADWLNLNGHWGFALTSQHAPEPSSWESKILVPFPVESPLSGVNKNISDAQRLWYHRTFTVPAAWQGKRVLLHFGAADWETTVSVNGKQVGTHRGGYDAFNFDITGALKPSGTNELVVTVWDPADAGAQPRGKQVRSPRGIWYTGTSGLWQTVWLEPVAPAHIESVKITPDLDQSAVTLEMSLVGTGGKSTVKAEVLDGAKVVQSAEVSVDGSVGTLKPKLSLKVKNAKPWSPDSPFLYALRFTLHSDGKQTDDVESYFGLRKISLAKDTNGLLRLCLNNAPLFQLGPLDQGFWPDGGYTAPSDEALRYDIETMKQCGFNMCRKHVKIEPERWYYLCDKLGLLVWQDMPNGAAGDSKKDKRRSDPDAKQFEAELQALIEGRYNHPSIVVWIPFNEGWGQYDTERITGWVKQLDPTRLVISASGWVDRGTGDIQAIHGYPFPQPPKLDGKRACVVGEFGGFGLAMPDKTWPTTKTWSYSQQSTPAELGEAYVKALGMLEPLARSGQISGAVYTQLTDVESEINGLMTYDRSMLKLDPAALAAANRKLYAPSAGMGTKPGP